MVDMTDLKSVEQKRSCGFNSHLWYNVTIRKNGGTNAKYEMETFETCIKEWMRNKPHSRYNLICRSGGINNGY